MYVLRKVAEFVGGHNTGPTHPQKVNKKIHKITRHPAKNTELKVKKKSFNKCCKRFDLSCPPW